MKKSNLLKTYLIISALLLTFIGGATLVAPVEMKGSSGIEIAGNISVINDIRAASALYLSIAILAFAGAFKTRLTYTSSLVTPLLFLSLGFGRILSVLLDGMPVEGLLAATGLEIVLGLTGIVLFKKNQNAE